MKTRNPVDTDWTPVRPVSRSGAETPTKSDLDRRKEIADLYEALADVFEQRNEQTWRPRAACLGMGPGLFFPGSGAGKGDPSRVCDRCDVQKQCEEDNLAERRGFVGGMTAKERQRERVRRSLGHQGGGKP